MRERQDRISLADEQCHALEVDPLASPAEPREVTRGSIREHIGTIRQLGRSEPFRALADSA